ncbi:MAG TPA: di-trans,poly-cis-decaprenylcistransferase [Gemmatimonadaceae bacterium]|nr:di-trans,poly-cis-decaprenylcistransferase [Gemmatimonadaceae bacterium]
MRSDTTAASSASALHAAIIMDGNGRWAAARGLPRTAGHKIGARAVRRVVETAPRVGIRTLTLYAFSADNWQRPRQEVAQLMRLFRIYLLKETDRCVSNGVRLTVVGRRDRLAPALRMAIEEAERATAGGTTLHLRVAVDYSARDSILRAARRLQSDAAARECFATALGAVDNDPGPVRDVDLLIRTGGEQRLSDFLLWECAYAELFFTPTMWPDFGAKELEEAVSEFHSRHRRFGRVPEAVAG